MAQFAFQALEAISRDEIGVYHTHENFYEAIRDAFLGDRDNNLNLAEQGQCIIISSSFQVGEHHMTQLFQDAMAIVRTFGKPDIFLTITANPNWPEIQGQAKIIIEGDRNCPDIVACVFELKKNARLKELKDGMFGRVVILFHTI